MLSVVSSARGKHLATPYRDKDGREILLVVFKMTFVVDAQGGVHIDEKNGKAPYLVDECQGDDPAKSSIKKPSDLFDFKPGTDVILVGHAHPPRAGAAHVDVTMRMGSITKTVRAHGLRVWQSGVVGVSPGPARPIRSPVPLTYELAWGGFDLSDPEKIVAESRNHVGRGVARDPKALVDQPAAQLEDPAHPIGGLKKNIPWSFGAIHRHWEPRINYAGTYDTAWSETRMPILPLDFDQRFHVVVPPEQHADAPLRGDEPIEIVGATPDGSWRFALPRIVPGFSQFVRGAVSEHRTHLDTVLIDADERTVELTWRATIPMPRKYEMLERVRILEKTIV